MNRPVHFDIEALRRNMAAALAANRELALQGGGNAALIEAQARFDAARVEGNVAICGLFNDGCDSKIAASAYATAIAGMFAGLVITMLTHGDKAAANLALVTFEKLVDMQLGGAPMANVVGGIRTYVATPGGSA